MSTAEGWDFTVPEDEAELLAELRRHGAAPGKRFHVVETLDPVARDAGPRSRAEELSVIGSVKGGPRDLARNTDEYLAGFGE
jgi:hypothetical protein